MRGIIFCICKYISMLVFVNCSCTHGIILVWIVVACKLSYKSPVLIHNLLELCCTKTQYSKLLLQTTNEMAAEVDSWHTARINDAPDVQRSYDANTWFTCCVQEHPSMYEGVLCVQRYLSQVSTTLEWFSSIIALVKGTMRWISSCGFDDFSITMAVCLQLCWKMPWVFCCQAPINKFWMFCGHSYLSYFL